MYYTWKPATKTIIILIIVIIIIIIIINLIKGVNWLNLHVIPKLSGKTYKKYYICIILRYFVSQSHCVSLIFLCGYVPTGFNHIL